VCVCGVRACVVCMCVCVVCVWCVCVWWCVCGVCVCVCVCVCRGSSILSEFVIFPYTDQGSYIIKVLELTKLFSVCYGVLNDRMIKCDLPVR